MNEKSGVKLLASATQALEIKFAESEKLIGEIEEKQEGLFVPIFSGHTRGTHE